MRLIGKILWTTFTWTMGVIVGAVGFATLEAFLEDECDGFISKLFMRMFPKD